MVIGGRYRLLGRPPIAGAASRAPAARLVFATPSRRRSLLMPTTLGRLFRATLALCSIASTAACGAAQIPPDARPTVLSVANLDCAGCGERLARDLAARDGVYRATFDKRRSEVTVLAAPSVDVRGAAEGLARGEEYTLVPGAGKGSYLGWAPVPEGADVVTVAKDGADVPDLAAITVPGKVTIVDFSALWCEPCRVLDEHVLAIAKARPDVAYRKLDVGDWDTPLARRYLEGVPSLPYVIVFDKHQARVDAIAGLDPARLDAAIAKASR
jgi:thiol-disulfide isomerase/thioredoxin